MPWPGSTRGPATLRCAARTRSRRRGRRSRARCARHRCAGRTTRRRGGRGCQHRRSDCSSRRRGDRRRRGRIARAACGNDPKLARRKSIAGTPGPPGFTTNDPIRRAGFVAGRRATAMSTVPCRASLSSSGTVSVPHSSVPHRDPRERGCSVGARRGHEHEARDRNEEEERDAVSGHVPAAERTRRPRGGSVGR